MWRCRRDCDPDPEPRSPGLYRSSSPFDSHGHELGVPAGRVLPPHLLGHREAFRPRFTIPAVWLGAWLLQYSNPMYLELMMGAGNSRRGRRSRVKRGRPVRSRIPRSICAVPRDGGCLRSSGLWKTFSTDSSGWPRLNLRRHKHAPATSRWTLTCICTRFRRQRFYVHNRWRASTDNLIRKR